MATILDEKIFNFNQEALIDELSSALIIQNQLHAITNDLVAKYPFQKTRDLQETIHTSTEQAIKGMLQANSRESFLLQQKKLNGLLSTLKTEFSLDGDLDKALHRFRFFLQVLHILRNTTFETRKDQKLNFTPSMVNLSIYGEWQNKLNRFLNLRDEQAFADNKSELMAEVLEIEAAQNLANLASWAYIKQNIQQLAAFRLSYLKSEYDRKNLLIDLGWIGVGVVLLAVAVILSFVLPSLIIPAMLVGAAALGYGVIDFLRANVSILKSVAKVSIGKREAAKETIEAIQDLEQQISGFEKENFIERLKLQEKKWSTEKNILKLVRYGLATAGVFLAILGFIFVFPAVSVTFPVVVTLTTLSVVLTGITIVLWGYKVIREQIHLYSLRKEVEQQFVTDNKIINEAFLEVRKTDEETIQEVTKEGSSIKEKKPADIEKLIPGLFANENSQLTKQIETDKEESDSEGESLGKTNH